MEEIIIKKWCCLNPNHWMIEQGFRDLPPRWRCRNCREFFRCN